MAGSIVQRLREATRDAHKAMEALPFAVRLREGALDRAAYVNYLQAMRLAHAQLEDSATTTRHTAVARVWRDDMRKAQLLARDLHALGAPPEPTTLNGAVAQGLILTQAIRLCVAEEPTALLGYLYVFEGSTLGGAVIRRAIAKNKELGEGAAAYLDSYGATRASRWKSFGEDLKAATPNAATHAGIVDAAQACFAQLSQLFQGLEDDAVGRVPQFPVFRINPNAGHHPITQDPVEIDASLRAGEETLRDFPYLRARYGDRGLRFTRSDSAWVISLLSTPQENVNQQIRWLGQVLAARGMPRWLLERHLDALLQALRRAPTAGAPRYQKLAGARDMLRAERISYLTDAELEELARAFELAVRSAGPGPSTGLGGLIGAAVADEANGVSNAVTSLTTWLTDPERFAPAWRRAVRSTLARARKQVHGRMETAKRAARATRNA